MKIPMVHCSPSHGNMAEIALVENLDLDRSPYKGECLLSYRGDSVVYLLPFLEARAGNTNK
jgi:hypothetical protein